MPILNYTSKISPTVTIGEIQQNLIKHGARKIITDFDEEGAVTAVTFHIDLRGRMVFYALPCNWQGVLKVMQKQKVDKRYLTAEQAQRTAWRILKDWIDAQMAIIEAGLATLPEIMLPYAVTNNGKTLFQRIDQDPTLLLPP